MLCSDENNDLIEETVPLQTGTISRNGSSSPLINSPFASDIENVSENESNEMSPDGTYHRISSSRNGSSPLIFVYKHLIIIISAQLNAQDSDNSMVSFNMFVPMRRRANVLSDHSDDETIHLDENEEPRQEEYQCNYFKT